MPAPTSPPPIVIARRFCGPPDSGNGGYSAGLLAAHLDAPAVEVTLRRPPPLERPLAVERDGDVTVLRDGDAVVAEAAAVGAVGVTPTAVAIERARTAAADSPLVVHPEWHPFPGCFVCGPDRAVDDGLRLFAGPVADGVYATTWVPAADLAGDDADPRVRPEFVWAALDCPSSMGIYDQRDVRPERAYVLGRIAVQIAERPRVGEEIVVVARRIGRDGRKLFATSALQRPDGAVLAVARATWIGI